jgi:hypothetical protein
VTAWRDEAERTVQTLVHEAEHLLRMAPGEGGEATQSATPAAASAPTEAEAAKPEGHARPAWRWPLPGQFGAEDLQILLEEQLRSALLAFLAKYEAAAPHHLHPELEQLRERLAFLEARVAQLEAQVPPNRRE